MPVGGMDRQTDKRGAESKQRWMQRLRGWLSPLPAAGGSQPLGLSVPFPRLSPLPAHVAPGFPLHVPQRILPLGALQSPA